MSQKDFFFPITNRKVFNSQKSRFRLSLQAHQSKCSLANKNWTNHSTPSSATLTRTANSDLSRISHASGSFCGEGGGSVTSGGGGGGNGGSSVGTGGSHGRPTVPGRSMPRAKSSDTFEHSGVRGAQLAPVDNNNAPGVCSSSSNQFMSSSVNPGQSQGRLYFCSSTNFYWAFSFFSRI